MAKNATSSSKATQKNSKSFEESLWDTATKLRGNKDERK